jgi:hypothetical protein
VALDRCSIGFGILHGKVGQQRADVALEAGHSSMPPYVIWVMTGAALT